MSNCDFLFPSLRNSVHPEYQNEVSAHASRLLFNKADRVERVSALAVRRRYDPN